jgi:hypothetical protein
MKDESGLETAQLGHRISDASVHLFITWWFNRFPVKSIDERNN